MTDLPAATPHDVVTEQDIQQAFEGLEPGWYRSADLLPRFNGWAESNGHRPTTVKTLGESIRREFKPRSRKVSGGVSLWYLDEAVLAHRAWFKSDHA